VQRKQRGGGGNSRNMRAVAAADGAAYLLVAANLLQVRGPASLLKGRGRRCRFLCPVVADEKQTKLHACFCVCVCGVGGGGGGGGGRDDARRRRQLLSETRGGEGEGSIG